MYTYISSKDNDKIKYIKKLDTKKYRDKENLYIIEGIKMSLEVVNSMSLKQNIEFALYSKEILQSINNGDKMLDSLKNLSDKTNVIETTKEVINYLTSTVTPQGIILVVKKSKKDIFNYIKENKNKKFLIVDRVQDAGNLGSIIRSANAFDCKNIICIKGTTDPFSDKVIRSTMGGFLKTNIFEVEKDEIKLLINTLKEQNYNIAVTALYNSVEFEEAKLQGKINKKTIFVVGNEANGACDEFLENADIRVRLKMSEDAESLNVAMATSICLYEQYVLK